jgi:hypothetical protein
MRKPLVTVSWGLGCATLDPAGHREDSRVSHADEAQETEEDVQGAGARCLGYRFIVQHGLS